MKMKFDYMIYGASGHGKVIADILEAEEKKIIGFIDDDPAKAGNEFYEYPVISYKELLKTKKSENIRLILGIGDNLSRKKLLVKVLDDRIVQLGTAVHPTSVIAKSVKIGLGTVVMAGGVINCDSSIGENAIINTAASIDHDCQIGELVHVSPGSRLGGGVIVGSMSWIGIGASIINNCRIGNNVIVGMGSVVIKDIPDCCVVAGNPARYIRKNETKS